jgi:hypothetical protein
VLDLPRVRVDGRVRMSDRSHYETLAKEWIQKCAMANFIEQEMGPTCHPLGYQWNDTDVATLASLIADRCVAARVQALEDAACTVDTLGNARWDEATGLEENGEDDEAEAYEEQGMALSHASVAIRALKETP